MRQHNEHCKTQFVAFKEHIVASEPPSEVWGRCTLHFKHSWQPVRSFATSVAQCTTALHWVCSFACRLYRCLECSEVESGRRSSLHHSHQTQRMHCWLHCSRGRVPTAVCERSNIYCSSAATTQCAGTVLCTGCKSLLHRRLHQTTPNNELPAKSSMELFL